MYLLNLIKMVVGGGGSNFVAYTSNLYLNEP